MLAFTDVIKPDDWLIDCPASSQLFVCNLRVLIYSNLLYFSSATTALKNRVAS